MSDVVAPSYDRTLKSLLTRITKLPGVAAARIFNFIPLEVALEIMPHVDNWDDNLHDQVFASCRSMRLLFNCPVNGRLSPRRLIEQSPFAIPYSSDLDDHIQSNHELSFVINEVLYDQLLESEKENLVQLLSKVTILEVAVGHMASVDDIQSVTRIITGFGAQLEHFKLFTGIFNMNMFEKIIARIQLHKAIKQNLISLTHLTICNQEYISNSSVLDDENTGVDYSLQQKQLYDFPILSHLKEFYYADRSQIYLICESMNKHCAELPDDLKLGLYQRRGGCDNEFFGRLNSKLKDKLTHALYAFHPWNTLDSYQLPSLVTMCRSIGAIVCPHLCSLSRELQSKPQLVHLQLNIREPVINDICTFYQPTKFKQKPTNPGLTCVLPYRSPLKLAHIKVLTLYLHTTSHDDIRSPHWATVFSEVQVIELANFKYKFYPNAVQDGCTACNIEAGRADETAIFACFKQMAQAFRGMPKLKFIYEKRALNKSAKRWTVQELF